VLFSNQLGAARKLFLTGITEI